MKKYECKRVEFHSVEDGTFSYNWEMLEEPAEIMNSYAEKGFRYVGYIPVTYETGQNRIKQMDLIFEKDC